MPLTQYHKWINRKKVVSPKDELKKMRAVRIKRGEMEQVNENERVGKQAGGDGALRCVL